MHIGTERPTRVSLDCLDWGGSGSVHTLSVTCSARIRRTPLHFDTCNDADTCPSLATTDGGQQRRGCWTVMLVAESTGGSRMDDGR